MSCKEGKFTKMIIKETPMEFDMVEQFAGVGWVLINIIKHQTDDNKWIYWFQTKRKLYERTQIEQLMKKHKHSKH